MWFDSYSGRMMLGKSNLFSRYILEIDTKSSNSAVPSSNILCIKIL